MKIGTPRLMPIVLFNLIILLTSNAHAVDRWLCNSGEVPKYKSKTPVYYIDPVLYDNDQIKNQIIRAFEEFSSATGWNLTFKYARGSAGSFGDGVNQVRMSFDRTFNGRSVALPTSDSGQCTWYDNDIELSYLFLRKMAAGSNQSQHNVYRLMLHEIAHAVGMKHEQGISVVQNSSGLSGLNNAYYDGLFGPELRFLRTHYGQNTSNMINNFRADAIEISSGTMKSFFLVDVLQDYQLTRVSVPITVTNEGKQSYYVDINVHVSYGDDFLFGPKSNVIQRIRRYVDAADTENWRTTVTVPRRSYGEFINIGFEIDGEDDNPWDDYIRLGSY